MCKKPQHIWNLPGVSFGKRGVWGERKYFVSPFLLFFFPFLPIYSLTAFPVSDASSGC